MCSIRISRSHDTYNLSGIQCYCRSSLFRIIWLQKVKEMKKLIMYGLLGILSISMGCAAHRSPTMSVDPAVYIAEGSDPVPTELIDHIIKRTNQFCLDSGRPGVEEVAIFHDATKRHTNVTYICITDPKTIGEVATSDVPFRVVDEQHTDGSVVSFLSSKAVYCLYIDPTNCGERGVKDE